VSRASRGERNEGPPHFRVAQPWLWHFAFFCLRLLPPAV